MRAIGVAPIVGVSWLVAVAGCGRADPPVAERVAAVTTTPAGYYTADTDADLKNPERGVAYWYPATTAESHTLEYHFLWLDGSCNVDLWWNSPTDASPVLETWYQDQLTIRANGRKAIFRPRYDNSAAPGTSNSICHMVEPAGPSTDRTNNWLRLQNHARAIAKMLAEPQIKPTVAFIEMGYLGSWGEWNTEKTGCGASIATCRPLSPVLLASSRGHDRISFASWLVALYRANGMTRPVELRRPGFHNDLVNPQNMMNVTSDEIGFHDDCFMENSSDGGTFSLLEAAYAPWGSYPPLYSTLTEAQAKQHLVDHAGAGAQGGEACSGGTNQLWQNSANVAPQLDQWQYDYLNGGIEIFRDKMVLDRVWDEIRRRLGYRYQVASVSYPPTAATSESIQVSVAIGNDGFARIPYDRPAYVVLRGPVNYVVGTSNPKPDEYTLITPTQQSNAKARDWVKGGPTTFTQTFPAPPVPGTYHVHLYLPDPDCVPAAAGCDAATRANYAVRLAAMRGTTKVFDEATGTNNLDVSIDVGGGGAACAGNGNLVHNCDFGAGTTNWTCPTSGSAAASCSVVNGALDTHITSPGGFVYSVQPNQGNLPLTNGTSYTVRFDARASVGRSISVSVTMNHDSFSSYSGVRAFTLGTTMAPYSFTFTMAQPSDTNAKLEFDLGANGANDVFLDNVVVAP